MKISFLLMAKTRPTCCISAGHWWSHLVAAVVVAVMVALSSVTPGHQLQMMMADASPVMLSGEADKDQLNLLEFIQLTDLHIDTFYDETASPASNCHTPQSSFSSSNSSSSYEKPAKRILNHYGISGSGCDSPRALVDDTLKYIKWRWVDRLAAGMSLDSSPSSRLGFVLLTGDNSRHDRDNELPKTSTESIDQNSILVQTLLQTFNITTTVIVPTIGNWDVYPVSQLAADPTTPLPDASLVSLWRVWRPLFPDFASSPVEVQQELIAIESTFTRGGYYARTLVQGVNGVTALSLNSLSFFIENDLVGDCSSISLCAQRTQSMDAGSNSGGGGKSSGNDDWEVCRDSLEVLSAGARKGGAGDDQLAWLESQLRLARSQSRKVIILGHVSPTTHDAILYRRNCLDWYSYLSGAYSDVILMQYFGHINRDMAHFVMAPKRRRSIINSNNNTTTTTTNNNHEIIGKAPSWRNPYRIISMSSESIASFDIDGSEIVGTLATSVSVLPVYHPGFRVGHIKRDAKTNVWSLVDQETWVTDVSRFNERYSNASRQADISTTKTTTRTTEAEARTAAVKPALGFRRTCSTRDSYNMTSLSPNAWTGFISRLQAEGRKKKNKAFPLREMYERCVHASFGAEFEWEDDDDEEEQPGPPDGGGEGNWEVPQWMVDVGLMGLGVCVGVVLCGAFYYQCRLVGEYPGQDRADGGGRSSSVSRNGQPNERTLLLSSNSSAAAAVGSSSSSSGGGGGGGETAVTAPRSSAAPKVASS